MGMPRFLLLLLIPLAALAACGSSDDGDEARIVETIETQTLSTDPADCRKLATQRYLEQTELRQGEGAWASCEYDATNAENDINDVESVDVSNVEIDGPEATAEVAFEGGTFDGQVFSVVMVEEDGRWKMGEITGFAEFDQARFAESLEEQVAKGPGGAGVRNAACVGEKLGEMSRSEIEEIVTGGTAMPVVEIMEACR